MMFVYDVVSIGENIQGLDNKLKQWIGILGKKYYR